MTGMKYYGLEGQEMSMMEWARLYEGDQSGRIIEQTDLPNGAWVSTVLLGIDHNFLGDGPPIIFETMVFESHDNFVDMDMERYATKEAAIEGHARMIAKWSGWTPGEDPPSDDVMVVMYPRDRVEDYRENTEPGTSYALADDVSWTGEEAE